MPTLLSQARLSGEAAEEDILQQTNYRAECLAYGVE
jgi:hypothetical protein